MMKTMENVSKDISAWRSGWYVSNKDWWLQWLGDLFLHQFRGKTWPWAWIEIWAGRQFDCLDDPSIQDSKCLQSLIPLLLISVSWLDYNQLWVNNIVLAGLEGCLHVNERSASYRQKRLRASYLGFGTFLLKARRLHFCLKTLNFLKMLLICINNNEWMLI